MTERPAVHKADLVERCIDAVAKQYGLSADFARKSRLPDTVRIVLEVACPAVVQTETADIEPPQIHSIWEHRNGNFYRVEEIGNADSVKDGRADRYPPTVWYRNVATGKPYNRKLSDWHRSMTLHTPARNPMPGLAEASRAAISAAAHDGGPGQRPRVIILTEAERQSGMDRVRWAEGLIRQLPVDHDGRNSWLMNFGSKVSRVVDTGGCAPPVHVVDPVVWREGILDECGCSIGPDGMTAHELAGEACPNAQSTDGKQV